MTARELQVELAKDLEQLFSHSQFKTPLHTLAAPKVYLQNLPKRDAQTEEDPFPYIIVRLDRGGIEKPTEPHKVSLILVIGIFDEDTGDPFHDPPPEPSESGETWDVRNFGITALLEIIERIQAHYEKQPFLCGGAFTYQPPFSWALQDEESYPYYFGACELVFTLAAPRQERSQYT